MKRLFIASAIVFLMAIVAPVAQAGTNCSPKTGSAAVKTRSAVCPVMKSKIPDVKKAAGKSVYKGKTYYFCCSGCKPLFDANPAKYAPKKK